MTRHLSSRTRDRLVASTAETPVVRVPLVGRALVNCYLVNDAAHGITLIDAGFASSVPRITAATAELGAELGDIERIIVTHAHADHAGGVAAIAKASAATVLAHRADRDALATGTSPPVDARLRLAATLHRRPPRFPAIATVELVGDGYIRPSHLRIVHLPGHTDGHVGVLHEPSGVFVIADALFHVAGLRHSPGIFCRDIALAHETAARLAELDFDVAAFGHGRELKGEECARIDRLVAPPAAH